ncbi:MAG: dihydrofolate reductase [Cryomorphaceae bacterium]|jgi:dihydrofolate reductase|nr:dihydrofolate reductase [Cryomorphaceae bacterium]
MINSLSLIAALDANNGIGKDNDLMWNLPADMQFFKETTKGHVVIMGRKNYDSIPERFRPLPGRSNVVLSRQANFEAPGCTVYDSLETCLQNIKLQEGQKAFIIGGAQIYQLALKSNLVNEIYLTHIEKVYHADTFFPDFTAAHYQKTLVFKHPIDDKHEANFEVYKYTK